MVPLNSPEQKNFNFRQIAGQNIHRSTRYKIKLGYTSGQTIILTDTKVAQIRQLHYVKQWACLLKKNYHATLLVFERVIDLKTTRFYQDYVNGVSQEGDRIE